MSAFFNQYSYVIMGLGLFTVVAVLVLRQKVDRLRLVTLAILAVSIVGAWALMRADSGSYASAAEFDAALQAGRPVVLEFRSDYCMGCIMAGPEVERLATEYQGQVQFLRIDALSLVGKQLSARYALLVTPTFVYFDADGAEVAREVGGITAANVKNLGVFP